MDCERVETAAELHAALDRGVPCIAIAGSIADLPPLVLSRRQSLIGADDKACLSFRDDGVVLAGENRVSGLYIACPPAATAIGLAQDAGACEWIAVEQCRCEGVVQFVFADAAGDVDVTLDDLHILRGDAVERLPRPWGNGVEVLQGALTVWNRSSAPTTIALAVSSVVIGTAAQPVRGTGLFVAGNETETGGRVALRRFSSGPVSSDSTLDGSVTGTVAGGIFFLKGVTGDAVETLGDIVTWGANAVPVDNWGALGSWRIDGDARSYGPSAVGMVNAGQLDRCEIAGTIETFGDGARGCCIYAPTGTIAAAAIRTHGKAASALQVVERLEAIRLSHGIFTQGAPGEGLMKGKMISTPAHGVEIEPGGWLGELDAATIRVTGPGAEQIHAAHAAIAKVTRPR